MNSALDYGSRGYKFESCRGHEYINKKVETKQAQNKSACFFILGDAQVCFVDFQRGALRISGANLVEVTTIYKGTREI